MSPYSYLRELPIIKYLMDGNSIKFDSIVTFLTGENGIGKSTLIETLAMGLGFNPEGGSKNFNFSTRPRDYELADCLTIARIKLPKDGFF